jgi:hypothetical protein
MNAGFYISTGSKNTIIGQYTGNQGGLDIRTSSNYIVLSDGDGNPRGIFDSSGNFLVGLSSTEAVGTNAGTQLRADGLVYAAATSDAHILSRRSTDGAILNFRKDGTTVGSIGTHSTQTYIGTGDTGLYFNAGNDSIDPYNTSTPVARSDAISLGAASRKFKDLYLSGGVYLGGTGPANKLDDYEEGSFSPVVRDATSGGNTASSYLVATGRYTKVGRMVHVTINFVNIDTTGMTSGNSVYITGLPFTAVNSFGYPTVPVNVSAVSSTNGFVRGSVFYNADYLSLSEGTTTGGAALTISDLTSGDADIYINFSYEVQ